MKFPEALIDHLASLGIVQSNWDFVNYTEHMVPILYSIFFELKSSKIGIMTKATSKLSLLLVIK